MSDIKDQAVKDVNSLILSALAKHIPDVSMGNIRSYAHRVTIEIDEGTEYPQRYWLDRNGATGGTLFLVMYKPETEFTGDTVQTNYGYRAY
jgi:hypothetical protein